MAIPRILHQTWKHADVPIELARFQRSWLAHNPAWEYRFWTDGAARAFVARHEPELLPVYDAYDVAIKRVDAVRYVWMKHVGGVYVDLDFECLRPLDGLLADRQLLLGLEPIEHGVVDLGVHGRRPSVCNAFLASEPGHPFWELLLRRMVEAREAHDPLEATGPRLVTRVVAEYAGAAPISVVERNVLYPVNWQEARRVAGDTGRLILPPEAFAVHHWQGTWWRPGALSGGDVTEASHAATACAADAPPLLLVATPVRNARAHLPGLLDRLRALTYPHPRISLAFLDAGSHDGSFDELAACAPGLRGDFRAVRLFRHDPGAGALDSARARLAQLARARNRLVQQALDDEHWVLWLDADVRFPADLIEVLLAAGRDIVVPHCVDADGRSAALDSFQLEAGAGGRELARHIVDGLLQPPRGLGRRYLDALRGRPIVPLDSVSACALLVRADLHREGLCFPAYAHKLHIESEGLAMMAKDLGISCWGLPGVEIQHA
jgi:hypothetical protein